MTKDAGWPLHRQAGHTGPLYARLSPGLSSFLGFNVSRLSRGSDISLELSISMPAQTLFLIVLKMPGCPLSHYYQIKQHSPFGEGLGKPSRCLLVLLQRTSFSHLVGRWAPDLKTESFWNWAKGRDLWLIGLFSSCPSLPCVCLSLRPIKDHHLVAHEPKSVNHLSL